MRLSNIITAFGAVCTLTSAAPAQTRDESVIRDRITFDSAGVEIVGYHFYPTSQQGNVPVVIVAHGLGGLQTSRIQPFAERFASNGYHAITFDYRSWGESRGEPRNTIDVNSQQDDYRAAINAVKNLPGVDPNRIVLWGTSLSGGHVLQLSSQIPGLAGVIAQAPHVNGFATVGALPPESLPPTVAAGLEDAGRATSGQAPLYIPLAGRAGEAAALTQQGALEGYQFVEPNYPPPGPVFAARFVLQLPVYNPDTILTTNGTPIFMGIASFDNVTPPEPARNLATRIKADQHDYPGGHFDVYPGASQYESIVTDQVAFLKKNVPL